MRVEDRDLEALVLEEEVVGVARLELEPVRAGELVFGRQVPLGDAVPEREQAAGLIRRFGSCVLDQLVADGGRDHHQTEFSIADSTSSAAQNGADKYFQPPSARMPTTTPSPTSSASLRSSCETSRIGGT